MRPGTAILALGLLVADGAWATECAPWPGRRTPRLIVRERGTEVTFTFRGRLATSPERSFENATLTITAGELGGAILDGSQVVRKGRRSRRARVKASMRLPAVRPPVAALPATAVLAAPGYCVTADFDPVNCERGHGRRYCRATKTSAVRDLGRLAGTYEGVFAIGAAASPALAAVVDAGNGDAVLELRRSPYESTSLELRLSRDRAGVVPLAGYCVPADYIVPASGFLNAVAIENGIRLDGDFVCEGLENGPATLTLVKRGVPSPPSLSGTYALRLENSTNATLELVVDELGTATSMPTEERDEGGGLIGTIDAGTGFVGPSGLVWLTAAYRPIAEESPSPLRLSIFGRLVASDAATPAGGSFYVGAQPLVERAGSWTVE